MTIEIRGVAIDSALRARILARLETALAPLEPEPVTARATFFDENGPKGGLALRCALTVRAPHRPDIRVEEIAATPRTAFDGAFAKLERDLERDRDRRREAKRHPKKYYAARRAVAPAGRETSAQRPRPGPGRRRPS